MQGSQMSCFLTVFAEERRIAIKISHHTQNTHKKIKNAQTRGIAESYKARSENASTKIPEHWKGKKTTYKNPTISDSIAGN